MDKPKGMVEVDGTLILTHCFKQLVELGADELVKVVGYLKQRIFDHYGDEFAGVPITYTHQRERLGLGHAVFQVEPHIDGSFLLRNGDNVFAGSVTLAVAAAEEGGLDGVLAVESVSKAEATTTGSL